MKYITIANGKYLELARKAQAEAEAFGDTLEIVTPEDDRNPYMVKVVTLLGYIIAGHWTVCIDADTTVVGKLPDEAVFDQDKLNVAEIAPQQPSPFAIAAGPAAIAHVEKWLDTHRQYKHRSPYDTYSLRKSRVDYAPIDGTLFSDRGLCRRPDPKWIDHHRISMEKLR